MNDKETGSKCKLFNFLQAEIFICNYNQSWIIVWEYEVNMSMVCECKYFRTILYSMIDEECGQDCGNLQTVFLKVNFPPFLLM